MALKKCKECGHQVSSKAKTCPNCGYKLKKSKKLIWQGFGCLFWIGVFFLMFSWASTWEFDDPEPWDQRDNSTMAYIQMERFVKDRLVSPSTADFPGVFDGVSDHVTRDGTTYTINSYVDSQNRMGGTIRVRFNGTIEQVDDSTWRLINLDIRD